jgi:ParB-like chromosome segregation protein Spo0J
MKTINCKSCGQPAAPAQDHIPFHPLADVFPLMKGKEFDELVADIKARGLVEPIVTFKGKILDGRNRARACAEAGVKPHYREFVGTDEDARAFVISANIRRRHLTAAQARALIKELLKANPETSDRQIAKMVNKSPTTVGKVRSESTVQSGQLKRKGADGRTRRLPEKTKPPAKAAPTPTPAAAPTPPPAAAKPLGKRAAKKQQEEALRDLGAQAAKDLLAKDRAAARWLHDILRDPFRKEGFILELSFEFEIKEAEESEEGNDVDPASSAENMKARHAAEEAKNEQPKAASETSNSNTPKIKKYVEGWFYTATGENKNELHGGPFATREKAEADARAAIEGAGSAS